MGAAPPDRCISPREQSDSARACTPGKIRGHLPASHGGSCPRTDSHLTYMINITLTMEFTIHVRGELTEADDGGASARI